MSNIEHKTWAISVGCAALLAAGIALQISALYAGATASNIMKTFGRVGTFVGGAGLGIALPIYILKKSERDPHIYKKVLIAALVGVVAGAALMGINTGHSASKMIGQSLLTISGGILVTAMFYWLIYGQDAPSSSAAHKPKTTQQKWTGSGQKLGRGPPRPRTSVPQEHSQSSTPSAAAPSKPAPPLNSSNKQKTAAAAAADARRIKKNN